MNFFNEFDALQARQYPNLRQNTANYKLNAGLPYHLELDVDSPYLAIFCDLGGSPRTSAGIGDTNLGGKWNFHQERPASRIPALGASLYFEFPTGDTNGELGSGLIDYWLNGIAQKHLTEKDPADRERGHPIRRQYQHRRAWNPDQTRARVHQRTFSSARVQCEVDARR